MIASFSEVRKGFSQAASHTAFELKTAAKQAGKGFVEGAKTACSEVAKAVAAVWKRVAEFFVQNHKEIYLFLAGFATCGVIVVAMALLLGKKPPAETDEEIEISNPSKPKHSSIEEITETDINQPEQNKVSGNTKKKQLSDESEE